MEEILRQKIQQLAGERAWYQIIIALGVVWFIVTKMPKHFKEFNEALPSIRKFFAYVHKKWFSQAIFRSDVLKYMNNMQLKLNEIEKEVKYNGGSITTVEVIKRIEEKVEVMAEGIEYNRQVREINDKCASTMIFKVNSDGACYFINDAFLKFFGWQESDVLQFGFENIVHEDDVPEMRRKWQKAIDTKTNFKDEQLIKDCNNVWHKCQVSAYPVVIGGKLKKFKGIIEVIE